MEIKNQGKQQSTKEDHSVSEIRSQFYISRKAHWEKLANEETTPFLSKHYKKVLERVYQKIIPKNSNILEIGCGTGELLKSLEPSHGLGVDFSDTIVNKARSAHPELEFQTCDVNNIRDITGNFDYIILSDVINDLFDIQEALAQVKFVCKPETRIVVNFFNYLWHLPINIGRKFGFARSMLPQNWVSCDDFKNLLKLTGYDVVSHWNDILLPLNWMLPDVVFNRFLSKLWPLSHAALSSFFIFRNIPEAKILPQKPSVSIIVAARNEAGHIKKILDRVPLIGSKTELIFVEGGSSDDTYQVISDSINDFHKMPIKLYKQQNKGKGDAIRLGFEKAENDILMILDADLTVMPEDLNKFYHALIAGRGDLINGVRLVYPMEKKAMRFLNFIGNKFFSLGFSYVLNQPIKDTLCGTKVLFKDNYLKIAAHRSYFGDFDPYGDFDLIFGAAKQNFKIIDMPVRYQARVYGETNINRWEGGWLLFKMLFVACKKLKFI